MNPIRSIVSAAHGITGYMTYSSRRKMNQVYSEYFIYTPLYEIFLSQGWKVRSEVAVNPERNGKGDKKRIDFMLESKETVVGIEVKWIFKKTSGFNLQNDIQKLSDFKKSYSNKNVKTYLFIAGRIPKIILTTYKDNDESVGVRDRIRKIIDNQFVIKSGNALYRDRIFVSQYATRDTHYGVIVVAV